MFDEELDPNDPEYQPIHEAGNLCYSLHVLSSFVSVIDVDARPKFIPEVRRICGRLSEIVVKYWPEQPELVPIIEQISDEFYQLTADRQTDRSLRSDLGPGFCPRCGSKLFDLGFPWHTHGPHKVVDLDIDLALAPESHCLCKICIERLDKLIIDLEGVNGLFVRV